MRLDLPQNPVLGLIYENELQIAVNKYIYLLKRVFHRKGIDRYFGSQHESS